METTSYSMLNVSSEEFTTFAPMDDNDSLNVSSMNGTIRRGATTPGIVMSSFFAIICVVGLLGNGLVVFVITRYTKMKTVTNMYILNLSIADFFFLLCIPFAIVVVIRHEFIGGAVMCKIYYMQTCINWFTGTFTLVVMSADRFMAVCYPITSMKYRTPKYALIAIGVIWLVSFVAMLPVVLFVGLTPSGPTTYSCNIVWPSNDPLQGYRIFILYDFTLSFLLPVCMICVFYALLLCRLQSTGSQIRNADRRRSHRKVTKLVSLIIVVFIFCWLPFWSFQVFNVFRHGDLARWHMYLNFVVTILSYANSMVNPMLYAFTNENFRESFICAFKCAVDPILGGSGGRRWSEYMSGNNNSVIPQHTEQHHLPCQTMNEATTDYEFTMLNSNSNSPGANSHKRSIVPDDEQENLTASTGETPETDI